MSDINNISPFLKVEDTFPLINQLVDNKLDPINPINPINPIDYITQELRMFKHIIDDDELINRGIINNNNDNTNLFEDIWSNKFITFEDVLKGES